MMQKRYRFFFLFVLIFVASCDEIRDGGENDDGSPTIIDFDAEPTEISPGGSATLLWSVNDATSITIDNGVGDVSADADNRVTVNPTQTTTYTLTATNAQGDDQAQTKVTVSGDTPPPPPPGEDTAAPTGDFGLSESQNGPFQNDKPNDITSPDDERIVTVAPGGTFYAQVAYSDPSGVTDIAINLVSSNPPDIAGELDPTQQFFTLGDPVGGCALSSTQIEVTCVYPITVSDDAVNITELPNSAGEFAYVFRTLVTDGAGNQSEEFIRGYVIVDGDGGGNPNPPTNPPANADPNADAGDDATVTVGEEVELDGSGSSDPDGDTLSYTWEFTSQPDGSDVSLNDASTATPSFTPTNAGNYVAQLTVSDGNGGSDTDSVTVTAGSGDQPPTNPNPPAAPSISSFAANPSTIDAGDSSTLSWSLGGGAATTVTIDNGVGDVTNDDDDEVEVSPTETTTYTITASNDGGDDTETVQVTVNPSNPNPAAPIIDSFTATPNPANVDDEVTLSWTLSGGNATTLTVTDLESEVTRNVTNEASTEIDAVSTRDFRLTATNEAGAVSEELTLTVEAQQNQAPTADFTFEQQEGSLDVQFNASSSSDPDGSVVSYSWDFGDGSDVTTGGAVFTKTYSEAGSYEVTLTVTDNGSATSAPVTEPVQVASGAEGGAPIIIDFTASPSPAAVDEEVTLTWALEGEVDTLVLTDLESMVSRTFPEEGSTVIPSETTITAQSTRDFRLTATNEAGAVSEELTLTVNSPDDNGGVDANDDSATLDLGAGEEEVDIDVTSNDVYPEDGSPNVFVSTPPSNGTATKRGNIINYQPDGDFTEMDTFEYTLTIRDRGAGTAFSDTALVTVNVQN